MFMEFELFLLEFFLMDMFVEDYIVQSDIFFTMFSLKKTKQKTLLSSSNLCSGLTFVPWQFVFCIWLIPEVCVALNF